MINDRRAGVKPTPEALGSLLNLVLKCNDFQFKWKKNYLQVGAPSYANLFMAKLEEEIIYNCTHKPLVWDRYIDDIFFIWTHGEEELEKFLSYINGFHDSIKFTAETSKNKVNFLDHTKVKLTMDGDLYTDLYVKDTGKSNYLHFTSAHPSHCKRAIPYGQFERIIIRKCTKETDCMRNCEEKAAHFY